MKKERYARAMPWWRAVLRDESDRFNALGLATVLSSYTNDDDWCWPSRAKLAEDMEMSERAISRLVQTLVRVGVVCEFKRGGRHTITKGGLSNRYRLNFGPPPVVESRGFDAPPVCRSKSTFDAPPIGASNGFRCANKSVSMRQISDFDAPPVGARTTVIELPRYRTINENNEERTHTAPSVNPCDPLTEACALFTGGNLKLGYAKACQLLLAYGKENENQIIAKLHAQTTKDEESFGCVLNALEVAKSVVPNLD
jgi:biotin operon repressor